MARSWLMVMLKTSLQYLFQMQRSLCLNLLLIYGFNLINRVTGSLWVLTGDDHRVRVPKSSTGLWKLGREPTKNWLHLFIPWVMAVVQYFKRPLIICNYRSGMRS